VVAFTKYGLNDELRVNSGLTYGGEKFLFQVKASGKFFTISTFTKTASTTDADRLYCIKNLCKFNGNQGIDAGTLDSASLTLKDNFHRVYEHIIRHRIFG